MGEQSVWGRCREAFIACQSAVQGLLGVVGRRIANHRFQSNFRRLGYHHFPKTFQFQDLLSYLTAILTLTTQPMRRSSSALGRPPRLNMPVRSCRGTPEISLALDTGNPPHAGTFPDPGDRKYRLQLNVSMPCSRPITNRPYHPDAGSHVASRG